MKPMGTHRRLFWDQAAADAGDEPYFPEFTAPNDPRDWRAIHVPDSWFVYLLYTDRVRNPLYVGFTGNVAKRMTQHRKQKAWWPLVDRIVVDRFASREDALEVEERRICRMKPLFNMVSNRHTVEAD